MPCVPQQKTATAAPNRSSAATTEAAARALQRAFRGRKARAVLRWAAEALCLTRGLPGHCAAHRRRMFTALAHMSTAQGDEFVALLRGMSAEQRASTLDAAFEAEESKD